MTADLVARLEAEADLRDYVWTDTPTVNAPSKPVYSARVRALLREAASALRSSGEASAWRPIAEAPNGDVAPDEAEVYLLVYRPFNGGSIAIEHARKVDRLRRAAAGDDEECVFSHWMPLPTPPTPEAQGHE